MKKKIMDWAWGHCEWLHWFLRDDVSMSFKLLNLLSGDRLRNFTSFACMTVHDVKRYYDMIAELKAEYGDDLTLEKYDRFITRELGWHIDRAVRNCDDLWQV